MYYMFIRVTGPGAFAGVLTLSVTSIGMVSKLFIETIEDLDKKILESLDAAGCNTFQKIRYGILPQLFTNFVSTVIYRFEINIKDASTLGLVGAGGIGAPLIFAMNSLSWDEVGAILCGLVVLVLIGKYNALFIIIGIPIVIANIITIIIKYLDNFFIYISPLSITMFLSHSNIIH